MSDNSDNNKTKDMVLKAKNEAKDLQFDLIFIYCASPDRAGGTETTCAS